MKEFSDFFEDLSLIDLQIENATYTWYKGDNHEAATRIDRILISEEWDESFNYLKQIPLQRIISDHIPLALQGATWNKNRKYFKFEDWWLDTEGFTDEVNEWWNSFKFEGRPDFILSCKMKALRSKLKEWSRSTQGNLGLQRKELLEKMTEFKAVMTDRMLTEDEISRKSEVVSCLKLCAVDKAPRSDGTMGFYIKCWDVIKVDIMKPFQNFYDQEMFERRSFNATFVALIPKKKGASELRDCRPISLIESVYKIFSKVLNERVMEKLVESQ
ncbi:unnamed protein product [Withania somnifera]